MPRGWIFALLGLASCNATPALTFLDDWPADCRVRAQASSWIQLIEKSRPTAFVSNGLLLWCTPSGDSAWTFELAKPFIIEKDAERTWALLEEPDQWLNSEFEGEFVRGRAVYPTRNTSDPPHNHAERVGASKSWGELYKISCTHVPGGNHANQGTCVVLAWHRVDGTWQTLWEGYEATKWSMGSHGVDESYDFSVAEGPVMNLSVRQTHTTYSSFEEAPLLTLQRSGRLDGSRLAWDTSWSYEARPGETWERLAATILFYRAGYDSEVPGLVARLKESTGADPAELLKPGRQVILPPGIWP